MARFTLTLLLLLAACRTGNVSQMTGAATMTSLAIGAAAASRAAGGCIAICTGETFCNPKSGLCESLPCQGKCGSGEHCAQTMTDIRCVPDTMTGVESKASAASKGPAIVPVTPPNPSTGSPTIVPAAEQQPPK
jgi:hypothetical protein